MNMRLKIGCNERGQIAILEGSHYPDDAETADAQVSYLTVYPEDPSVDANWSFVLDELENYGVSL